MSGAETLPKIMPPTKTKQIALLEGASDGCINLVTYLTYFDRETALCLRSDIHRLITNSHCENSLDLRD